MKNILYALSLALLNNENIIIQSPNKGSLVTIEKIIKDYSFNYVVIDASNLNHLSLLVNQVTYQNDEGNLQLFEIIILDNFNNIDANFQKQLVKFFNILNDYDKISSHLNPKNYVMVGNVKIIKNKFQCFIGYVEISTKPPYFNKSLKEWFWFSQFELNKLNINNNTIGNDGDGEDDKKSWKVINDYKKTLLAIRLYIPKVYESPDTLTYMYSLIVHVRNHRLTTINQIQTRLHTNVINKLSKLSKSIVAWKNYEEILNYKDDHSNSDLNLFLTPLICRLAFRKIGYWLVDWDVNAGVFDFSLQESNEVVNKRKLIINMLVGEWYGSEWKYVEQYMKDHETHYDPISSGTGFSNSIIEDVVAKVRPPI